MRATTWPDSRRSRQAHRPVIVDETLRGTEDERQRRPQLVADVGKELCLDLVELADALEQALQLDVLLRNLALLRLLLGDVTPFAGEEHDLALIVLHGHDRGVDDDRHRAVGAREERRVPADELALQCARDGVAYALIDVRRHLPPERGPERLALDVGQLEADRVERDLIDLEDGSLGVEQPDELHHRVEGDPRDLLAVALAGIGGDDFRAAYGEWSAGIIDRHAVGILRCDTAIVNRASFP